MTAVFARFRRSAERKQLATRGNDRPSSFLAAHGKPELTEVGALLDRNHDVATALGEG
jgi:hypothetical protein